MEEKEFKPKKLSMTNTKKELLDSYDEIVKQMLEKEKAQLNPQKIVEEKQKKEAIAKVKEFSTENIDNNISVLNNETAKILDDLKLKLRKEINKYEEIQAAISVKESELKEIFEIEKSAHTLAALIETQNIKKEDFEKEMSERKKNLFEEIEVIKSVWEKEKAEHEKAAAELKEEEQKKRKREKEEYEYNFNREKLLAKNKLEDELKIREAEGTDKLNAKESELTQREKEITEKESEFANLKTKLEKFDEEIKLAVDNAVKDTIEKIGFENKNKTELLTKEYEGKENVYKTKIQNLEILVKEQEKKIEELSAKLDKAYQKVQDVAIKAIDGAANLKSFNDLQKILSDKASNKGNE